MRRRSSVAAVVTLLLATGCAERAPARLRDASARYGSPVSLPPPDTHGNMPLDEAISRRRSSRDFSSKPLPLAQIGQLLWAGQGITSPDGKRTAPSAGGLYPIELYVVTPHQVMHYLPAGHRVEVRADIDRRRELRDAAFGQRALASAPAVIVVAAVSARTRAKYGERSDTFVALEAGHVTQNILLEATEHSLAAVPIGGVDPARVRRIVAMPPADDVAYLIPVGYPG
jgi:SagB-type dehydrogenase family enzyme